MRVVDVLAHARSIGIDRLDAQLLLAHHLHRPRAWLLAHDDADLTPAQAQALQGDLQRRAAGTPLAYLVGEKEFHGLALQVSAAVLVPRPETELLVDWALQQLGGSTADVVDLGTGSGAIALAVKHRCPTTRLTATDASAAALTVAQANAARLNLDVVFIEGDWWQPLAGRRFDMVLSNPPYVAADDVHLLALAHEPRAALTPEGDGLAALRRIIGPAPDHLRPGGWILLEHGHDQAMAVRALLVARGFEAVATRHDLANQPRCTGGRWPG